MRQLKAAQALSRLMEMTSRWVFYASLVKEENCWNLKWVFPGVLAAVTRRSDIGRREANPRPPKGSAGPQIAKGQVTSVPWWCPGLLKVSAVTWSWVLQVSYIWHCGPAWWRLKETQDQLALIFAWKVSCNIWISNFIFHMLNSYF